jgi:hypothetical protein
MKKDMRQLLWLALIPLATFWLFSVDIYGQRASFIPALSCLLMGIAISVVSFWRAEASIDRKYGAILLPLLLADWAIPYPYNAGLIICIVGFAVALVAPRLVMIWLAAIFSGTVLILQSLALSIYYILAANYHFAGALACSIAFILDLTGIDAAANEGMVFILAQEKVFPFTVTFEKLGFYPWILIYVGSLLILFLMSQNILSFVKHVLLTLIASIFYLLLRYVILVHIFFFRDLPEVAGVRNDIFTDPWWLILSFVPLVLLFLRLKIPGDLGLDFQMLVDRKNTIALASAFFCVFCLTSSALFLDEGTEKDGRVLVDEIHSIWEFSTLKLDRNWYGENSTYNTTA